LAKKFATTLVAVVVGQEDPADVVQVDDRRDVAHDLLTVERGAGVHDDRFLGEDDEAVHEDVRAGLGRDEVGDQVRVRGDELRSGRGVLRRSGGGEAEVGRRVGEGHDEPSFRSWWSSVDSVVARRARRPLDARSTPPRRHVEAYAAR
jgi:hypothetical protein